MTGVIQTNPKVQFLAADGAPLVASVLEASIILDRSESAGLTRVVEELVESKQRIVRLKAVDLHSHPNVEGCMP